MISLVLLQDTGPTVNVWLVLFGTVGGAMAAVFGALLAARKAIEANLQAQVKIEQERCTSSIVACEKREAARVEKAETREDAALARLAESTSIITGLSSAVAEFGGVLKDTVAEIRKSGERSEQSVREVAELKREANSLRETTLREAADTKKEIVDLRREVLDLARLLRGEYQPRATSRTNNDRQ